MKNKIIYLIILLILSIFIIEINNTNLNIGFKNKYPKFEIESSKMDLDNFINDESVSLNKLYLLKNNKKIKSIRPLISFLIIEIRLDFNKLINIKIRDNYCLFVIDNIKEKYLNKDDL